MRDATAYFKELRTDYAATFNSPEGRRVLSDLMARFNVSRPHLTSDPIEMSGLEGQRSVVLHIFTMLRLSEADITRMIMRQPTMYDEDYDAT